MYLLSIAYANKLLQLSLIPISPTYVLLAPMALIGLINFINKPYRYNNIIRIGIILSFLPFLSASIGFFFLGFPVSILAQSLFPIIGLFSGIFILYAINETSWVYGIALNSIIFTFIGLIQWIIYVFSGRYNIFNFQGLMFFAKQDFTLIYLLLLGILFTIFFQKSEALDKYSKSINKWLFAFIILIGIFLFDIKSLLLVTFLIVLYNYIFLNLKNKRAIAVLFFIFIASATVFLAFPYILSLSFVPNWIKAFGSYLTVGQVESEIAKYIDTWLIRQEIINFNIQKLTNNIPSLFFGLGKNMAEGELYTSPVSQRTYFLPTAFESGWIWAISTFGLIGGSAILIYAISPLLMGKKYQVIFSKNNYSVMFQQSAKLSFWITAALIASNTFQDNINSTLWVFLGIVWSFLSIRTKQSSRK
jgi:hypothetical protein